MLYTWHTYYIHVIYMVMLCTSLAHSKQYENGTVTTLNHDPATY